MHAVRAWCLLITFRSESVGSGLPGIDMQFRWVALITLWTMFIGPILAGSSRPTRFLRKCPVKASPKVERFTKQPSPPTHIMTIINGDYVRKAVFTRDSCEGLRTR